MKPRTFFLRHYEKVAERGKRSIRELWDKVVPVEVPCEVCGTMFLDRSSQRNAMYCSGKCQQQANKANPDYYVMAVCPECNRTYARYKYSNTKTCSRDCGNKRGARQRRLQHSS